MNRILIIALLFLPMIACSDANAGTQLPNSNLNLLRYEVTYQDYLDAEQDGTTGQIRIDVPATSQIIGSHRIFPSNCDVTELQVVLDPCNSQLVISHTQVAHPDVSGQITIVY